LHKKCLGCLLEQVEENGDISTHEHKNKISKSFCSTSIRVWFFAHRVISVWNNLPQDIVDFALVSSFKRTVELVGFNDYAEVFAE